MANLLLDPSFETLEGWMSGKTANMIATLEHSSDSLTGAKAIKITSTYNSAGSQNASAYWIQALNNPVPNGTYRFRVHYKSNVQAAILIMSSYGHVRLDLPPSSVYKLSDWVSFTMPSDVTSARVDCRLFNLATGYAIFDDAELELVSIIPTHILTVESMAEIPFTINGVEQVTPYQQELEEGTYTITMPAIIMIGSDTYNFSEWDDGSTNLTKTIELTADLEVYAIYEVEYTTPVTLELEPGTYEITMPSLVTDGSETYNFSQWEDGSTNPVRTVNLTVDMSISAAYEAVAPPPPAKGRLEIHAYLDAEEVVAPCTVGGVGMGSTPVSLELDPGTYAVDVSYQAETKSQTAVVEDGLITRVDFQFEAPYNPLRELWAKFVEFSENFGLPVPPKPPIPALPINNY